MSNFTLQKLLHLLSKNKYQILHCRTQDTSRQPTTVQIKPHKQKVISLQAPQTRRTKGNFETPKSHHNQTQKLENQQAKTTRVNITNKITQNYYITEKPTRMDILQLSITVVTKNTRQQKENMQKTQTTSHNNCNNNQKALKKRTHHQTRRTSQKQI